MNLNGHDLNPPVIMAPMAGITKAMFRRFVATFGASMVVSEMISVEGLVRKDKRTWKYVELNRDIGALEVFQIFGSKESSFREATKMLCDYGVKCIDINAGCPVPKVVRQGGGAALIREPERLFRIVEAVRSVSSVPVTVKLRIGWDDKTINVLYVVRKLEELGVDAVTVHARTAKQLYSGKACWEWIRRVKKVVSIPVIGNGDIVNYSDAIRMFNETSCDAVMIGRGALGNPWLFQTLAAHFAPEKWSAPEDSWDNFYVTVKKHIMELADDNCNPGYIRKVLMWFSKGCPEATSFRYELIREDSVDGMLSKFDLWFDSCVSKANVSFLTVKGLMR